MGSDQSDGLGKNRPIGSCGNREIRPDSIWPIDRLALWGERNDKSIP